jgi:hypothetical protein
MGRKLMRWFRDFTVFVWLGVAFLLIGCVGCSPDPIIWRTTGIEADAGSPPAKEATP